MILGISGTPGTGKTTTAKKLAEELNYDYLDVKLLIEEKQLSEGFDKEKNCEIIDVEKLQKEVDTRIANKENVIIDSHLAHELKNLDLIVITKCELKELKKRLEKRNYSEEKVRENLDAEIFDVCLTEAKETKTKIIIFDTSKESFEELVKKISSFINKRKYL